MLDTLGRQVIEDWLHQYGPEPGPPPDSIVDALIALHRKELPDVAAEALSERTEEIVVAFGAGWQRDTDGREGWEGRWLRAMDRVTRHVHGWMIAVAEWLYAIPLHGYTYHTTWQTQGAAWEIARAFWEGTCSCSLVFYPEVDPPDVWGSSSSERQPRRAQNAQKRAESCLHTHSLQSWHLHDEKGKPVTLWNFIANAVKGKKRKGESAKGNELKSKSTRKRPQLGKKGFISGAFSRSMIFRHLYQHDGVRHGQVLSWCCPHHPDIPFEAPQCTECRQHGNSTVFTETQHYRKVWTRLLVAAPIGRYEPTRFRHCHQKLCENYYRPDLAVCPMCQHPPSGSGPDQTVVWIFQPRPLHDQGDSDSLASASFTGTSTEATGSMEVEDVLTGHDAINQLPPDQRKIIAAWNAGSTVEEIAIDLQLPLQEIQDKMAEACERLRTHLGPDFGHIDD